MFAPTGIAATTGLGTARCCEVAEIDGLETGFVFRVVLDSFEGRPPGPPGLISRPFVNGFGGTGLLFGMGRDTEFGGSPRLVCIVWDL
jgi:hypothetical protein